MNKTTKMNPWLPMTSAIDLKVMGKLGEELGECSAAVSRCIIQGVMECEPVTGKPNIRWLSEEIADVQASSELAIERFGLDQAAITSRKEHKKVMLREWHGMAQPTEVAHDIIPHDLVIESWPERPVTGMVVGMAKGVKITHKPTGTVVTCDTERSQHANRDKAWEKLQVALAAPRPWSGIDTAKLLANAGKPEAIDGTAVAQHERVSELLSWFSRLADGHANPKWTREHAFELAFYIATNAMNRQVDLESVRKAAFAEGVNITDAERAMLNRLSPEAFALKPAVARPSEPLSEIEINAAWKDCPVATGSLGSRAEAFSQGVRWAESRLKAVKP